VATVTRKPHVIRSLRERGATVLLLPGKQGMLSLRSLLRRLGQRGIQSVLVEGGATLAACALRERVVDRLLLFYGPSFIGADGRPMLGGLGVAALADAPAARDLRVRRLGRDLLVSARLGALDAV
jgi:diaminohydroxyphosphoribosylaminopyrimidine deaminase/5-amino-6-(5-phosphoribosylamino)uracil reductase